MTEGEGRLRPVEDWVPQLFERMAGLIHALAQEPNGLTFPELRERIPGYATQSEERAWGFFEKDLWHLDHLDNGLRQVNSEDASLRYVLPPDFVARLYNGLDDSGRS